MNLISFFSVAYRLILISCLSLSPPSNKLERKAKSSLWSAKANISNVCLFLLLLLLLLLNVWSIPLAYRPWTAGPKFWRELTRITAVRWRYIKVKVKRTAACWGMRWRLLLLMQKRKSRITQYACMSDMSCHCPGIQNIVVSLMTIVFCSYKHKHASNRLSWSLFFSPPQATYHLMSFIHMEKSNFS